MAIQVSQRSERVAPSATLTIASRCAELIAQGRDIISLGAGQPDFDTPDHIAEAGIEAIRQGKTTYTPVPGTPNIRQAVCEKLRRDNDLEYQPEQVIVSCGAKHSIYNLMQAVLDEGDEVIIPAPYWVSYPDIARLADATPVIVDATAQTQFKITPEQLEAAITDRSRLLVINSPSNPTGQAYRADEYRALGEVLRRHPRVAIMTDEIYEPIYWADEAYVTLLNVCPDLRERCVMINGVSKAYAMTGWRIGYAAGPANIVKVMSKLQGQSTSNACSISQAAAAHALVSDQSAVRKMARSFKQRHDYFVPALDELPGVECQKTVGTFYAFADFTGAIEKLGLKDDLKLADHLLDHAGVAMVPGQAFGAKNYLRASFASSMEQLQEAISRLHDLLK